MNIKDYLKYYIGCPAVNSWFPEDHQEYNKGWVLTAIQLNLPNPYKLETKEEETWTDSVKPILRRIESLTEAEMIGLLQSIVPSNMADKPTRDDYSLEMFYNDGGNLVDEDVAIGANYSCRCYEGQIAIRKNGDIDFFDEEGNRERVSNLPQSFHYLLSLGIDLFGLIDAGLAIDASTINQQTEGK